MKAVIKDKAFALNFVHRSIQLRNKNNRRIIRVMKDSPEKALSHSLSFAVSGVNVTGDLDHVQMWLVNKDRPEASVIVSFVRMTPKSKSYSVGISPQHGRNFPSWAKEVAAPCRVTHELGKGSREAAKATLLHYDEIVHDPRIKNRILTSTLTTKHKLYALLNEIHLSAWAAWMKEWIEEFKGPEELAYLVRYKSTEALESAGFPAAQIQHLYPTYRPAPFIGSGAPTVSSAVLRTSTAAAEPETTAVPPSIWDVLEQLGKGSPVLAEVKKQALEVPEVIPSTIT